MTTLVPLNLTCVFLIGVRFTSGHMVWRRGVVVNQVRKFLSGGEQRTRVSGRNISTIKIDMTTFLAARSGGSRISHTGGGATPKGGATYYLANFFPKMQNIKKLVKGVRVNDEDHIYWRCANTAKWGSFWTVKKATTLTISVNKTVNYFAFYFWLQHKRHHCELTSLSSGFQHSEKLLCAVVYNLYVNSIIMFRQQIERFFSKFRIDSFSYISYFTKFHDI